MADGFELRFHQVLCKRLGNVDPQGLLAVNEFDLSTGEPKDYPTYRERVGFIAGLREALKVAEEIRKDIVEGKA